MPDAFGVDGANGYGAPPETRFPTEGSSPMRRLLGLVLPALLAVTLLLPAAAASAAPVAASTSLVLATEANPDAPAPGLEPMDPDDTENPAAPTDYEANFLWGAAVGLFALILLGALSLAGLYYLLVLRPRQRAASGK